MLLSMVGIAAGWPAEMVICLASADIVRTHASSQSTVVQLGNLGLHHFKFSVIR